MTSMRARRLAVTLALTLAITLAMALGLALGGSVPTRAQTLTPEQFEAELGALDLLVGAYAHEDALRRCESWRTRLPEGREPQAAQIRLQAELLRLGLLSDLGRYGDLPLATTRLAAQLTADQTLLPADQADLAALTLAESLTSLGRMAAARMWLDPALGRLRSRVLAGDPLAEAQILFHARLLDAQIHFHDGARAPALSLLRDIIFDIESARNEGLEETWEAAILLLSVLSGVEGGHSETLDRSETLLARLSRLERPRDRHRMAAVLLNKGVALAFLGDRAAARRAWRDAERVLAQLSPARTARERLAVEILLTIDESTPPDARADARTRLAAHTGLIYELAWLDRLAKP